MNHLDTAEAVALIADGVREHEGAWADLGAGGGTFTRALVEILSADSRIYPVDRDPAAVSSLAQWAATLAPPVPLVRAVTADLTQAMDLAGLIGESLDGLLIANALHFIRNADEVLARLVTSLRVGGRVVIVEYDRRGASRWVPYPVPMSRLPSLASASGLSKFRVIASRPSTYEGILYAASADRAGP